MTAHYDVMTAHHVAVTAHAVRHDTNPLSFLSGLPTLSRNTLRTPDKKKHLWCPLAIHTEAFGSLGDVLVGLGVQFHQGVLEYLVDPEMIVNVSVEKNGDGKSGTHGMPWNSNWSRITRVTLEGEGRGGGGREEGGRGGEGRGGEGRGGGGVGREC